MKKLIYKLLFKYYPPVCDACPKPATHRHCEECLDFQEELVYNEGFEAGIRHAVENLDEEIE